MEKNVYDAVLKVMYSSGQHNKWNRMESDWDKCEARPMARSIDNELVRDVSCDKLDRIHFAWLCREAYRKGFEEA